MLPVDGRLGSPFGGGILLLSWQDVGSIGELVSAIAVVVSLIYLAFQIRQNTRQIDENTRAARAAAFDSSINHTFMARAMISESEDLARIYLQGSNDPEALSDEDLVRYRLLLHNILWSIWNMQSQAQVGELASETWGAQLAILKRIASTRGFQWFWANYSQEFGASFQRVVADLEEKR